MNKNGNTFLVDIYWDGLRFDVLIERSESMTLHGMRECGFQVLDVKVNEQTIKVEDIPNPVTELLLNRFFTE